MRTMWLKWPWKRPALPPQLGGFDAAYYAKQNPDVIAAGWEPIRHFLEYGWKERRDPCAHFSTGGYLRANPDVLKTGMDPLTHFWLHGLAEGRGGWQKHVGQADVKRLVRSRHADDFADIRRCLRAIEETMMWL